MLRSCMFGSQQLRTGVEKDSPRDESQLVSEVFNNFVQRLALIHIHAIARIALVVPVVYHGGSRRRLRHELGVCGRANCMQTYSRC